MHQVAAAIGEAIGKAVKYLPVTVEAQRQSMLRMGIDEWTANLLGDYSTAYSENWGDLVTDDFQLVTGKAPRSIAQFCRDFAAALGK
jgi:hypothetical protein